MWKGHFQPFHPSLPSGTAFSPWRAAVEAPGDMGCTPSKSAVIYTQDRVCRDLETCSTFVPSLRRSTPEGPQLCGETSRQTFLSVPCRDVHGQSVSQSSSAGGVTPGGSSCVDQCSMKPPSRTPDLALETEDCGTT